MKGRWLSLGKIEFIPMALKPVLLNALHSYNNFCNGRFMNIDISIITPVLNSEKHIESCIINVASQNINIYEHIIVDGCSTDGTLDIVNKLSTTYPNIKVISGFDLGQSDAMNKGLKLARGRIVSFLNVDDFYEPFILPRVIEMFSSLPEPSILFGNCNVLGDNDKLLEVNRPKDLNIMKLLLGWKYFPWPVNPSAYFYHASLHDKIGPYLVDEHYALDLHFLLRAVQAANVCYVNETFGNYRFIKGTKTWEDVNSGTNEPRSRKILDSFARELPLHKRIVFPLYRHYQTKIKKYLIFFS